MRKGAIIISLISPRTAERVEFGNFSIRSIRDLLFAVDLGVAFVVNVTEDNAALLGLQPPNIGPTMSSGDKAPITQARSTVCA
jgi:hypothetical protein